MLCKIIFQATRDNFEDLSLGIRRINTKWEYVKF